MPTKNNDNNDVINKPSHYTSGNIEVIDFIEDQGLGYHLGNVIKYISRAGKKDPSKEIEDLKKAKWYLERYINKGGDKEKLEDLIPRIKCLKSIEPWFKYE